MKSLYESILDSDEQAIKQTKDVLIREFAEIVLSTMRDIEVHFTPKKDCLVGVSTEPSLDNWEPRRKFVEHLKDLFADRMTYNRDFFQIHINIPYEKDLIRCSIIRTKMGKSYSNWYVLNIYADKQSTLKHVLKIFDEVKK